MPAEHWEREGVCQEHWEPPPMSFLLEGFCWVFNMFLINLVLDVYDVYIPNDDELVS